MQSDPYRFSQEEYQELEPVCRRLRSTNRTSRQILPECKEDGRNPSLENDLLGKNGLGLSTDEFSALPESERKELVEAVLKSKEEFQQKGRKTETEKQSPCKGSSKYGTSALTLPCSVPLSNIGSGNDTVGRITARPSLERLRLKAVSEVVAEVTRSNSEDAIDSIKSRYAAYAVNSDLGNWNKTLTDETKARYPRHSCGSDNDSPVTSEQNIPAASVKNVLTWEPNYLSPTKQLIRKYRIQAVDRRPFCNRKGLRKEDHVKIIWNYLTELEKLLYRQSSSRRTLPDTWGKPIPVAVAKGKQSTQAQIQNPNDFASPIDREAGDEKMHQEPKSYENLTSSDVKSKECGKNVMLKTTTDSDADRVAFVETNSTSVDCIDVVLDSRWKEDVESRLQNSRQMKIGGGVAEEISPKVKRKTMKRQAAKENNEDSENTSKSKKRQAARQRKQEKPKRDAGRLLNAITGCKAVTQSSKIDAEEFKRYNIVATGENERQLSSASTENSRSSGDSKTADPSPSRFAEGSGNESKRDCADNVFLKRNSSQEYVEKCDSDEEDVEPPSPGSSLSSRPRTGLQKSCAFDRLQRPEIREYNTRNRKAATASDSRNSNVQGTNSKPSDSIFSGDSSEDDDFDDERKRKRRQRCANADNVFGKEYSKKKIKTDSDQLTLKSFPAFGSQSNKIPSQPCPLCQHCVPLFEYESHVQECVERDDDQKRAEKPFSF